METSHPDRAVVGVAVERLRLAVQRLEQSAETALARDAERARELDGVRETHSGVSARLDEAINRLRELVGDEP
ncbi:MAG: hypothetical protein EA406_11625 [Rhodospirillales bacterium]|nr:MAG: hypothetical protein EA406_11625 [Rhodospirillales bacterium]